MRDKTTIFVVMLLISGFALFGAFYQYGTSDFTKCTVVEKERIVKKDSSKYLIFCEEEVFENSDAIWYGKFDSSDFYKDIRKGESYEFKVYGWRIPFLSKYRNIVKIK